MRVRRPRDPDDAGERVLESAVRIVARLSDFENRRDRVLVEKASLLVRDAHWIRRCASTQYRRTEGSQHAGVAAAKPVIV